MNDADLKRKADAAAALDATKQKLWTPDQKVPESVRKMAFVFFLERLKVCFTDGDTEFEAEQSYRDCLTIAKMIHRVDTETQP